MTPLVNTSEGYSKCMEVIQLILDGEAKEDDLAYFKNNISCCDKSMEHYKFEQEVRKNIKENCYWFRIKSIYKLKKQVRKPAKDNGESI